jgi:polysaccharide lyase family 4-like protein
MGSIRGVVRLDGDAPSDSLIVTSVDQEFCGPAMPDSSIIRTGDSLANVVVWLADVREGKPLPVERRTEIVNSGCRFEPRVQAVVAGTTVNVRNDDRLPHLTRFSSAGTNDTLARIPLTDDGQVVPNEHVAANAGLVAATCERHPWSHGYIAVFAGPYFAVTDVRGSFRLDSVPPGKYRLMAWHERGTRQLQETVEVSAGGAATVELQMRVR